MKSYSRFCICIICYTGFLWSASGQASYELRYWKGSVWLTGRQTTSIPDDQLKDNFLVYTQEAIDKKINQTIVGTYNRVGDSISFTPDFSLMPGGSYYAVFGELELSFSVPKERLNPTYLETVHPQSDMLPENMLRMYITFSGPMMPGEAYNHITLLSENGDIVEKPFLIIDQELWNPERKRFTLLFDPGRVKRGIQSNTDLGMPLQAGQAYKLVIDSAWHDAGGNFLAKNYTKTFSVIAAERKKLNIDQWKIMSPADGSYNDLLIEFDRPMDYALVMRCVTILSNRSGKVSGNVTFHESTLWRFTPNQRWQEGEYFVEVNPQLEDVAGNNLNNVFDIDISKESRVDSPRAVRRSFFIRPFAK